MTLTSVGRRHGKSRLNKFDLAIIDGFASSHRFHDRLSRSNGDQRQQGHYEGFKPAKNALHQQQNQEHVAAHSFFIRHSSDIAAVFTQAWRLWQAMW